MKQKLLFIILLCSFRTISSYAQSADLNLISIVPPSPTAAAMAKFGEIPVSTYTGIANISIPLYEVTNRELSLPIVLSYHSGGIKVEEEASWVGLGWSLMSGGMITRMVRGLDDLSLHSGARGFPDSYLPSSVDLSSYQYAEPSDPNQVLYDKNYLNDVINGQEDTEPDIFVFNFNGRSGKFILSKRDSPSMPLVPVLISQEDIRIEVSYSSQTSNYQWIITDEKGVKYFFSTVETTVSRSASADEEIMADVFAPEGLPLDVVSSWYLDRILSPTGAEIKFNYYSSYPSGLGTRRILNRSQIKKHVTEFYGYNGCTVPMNVFAYISTYTEVRDVYLKEIIFPNGKIEFKLSDRDDIEPAGGGSTVTYAKKLDEIDIFSGIAGNFTLLKKFIFNYSYFGINNGYVGKRLKLQSVTESEGTISRPPYLFTYNPLELPEKDAKSIDHWGFYNGADNKHVNETTYGDKIFNGTLIPPTSIYIPQSDEWREYAGANREPNSVFAQACMLTSITYPTGGSTSFQYELNDYYDPRVETIETGEVAYTDKFGPDTHVPNVRPESFIIELGKVTEVEVSTVVECYGGNTCLDMDVEYEYDVAHIEAIDGTPYFDQWIGYLLTYDNQGEGVYQEMNFTLPAGKYKFTVLADQNYVSRLMASWTVETPVQLYNHGGAGLRMKKVVTYDGVSHQNDQVTDYRYSKTKNGIENCSTGKLMTEPVYEYVEEHRKHCATSPEVIYAKSTVRSSTPLVPFSSAAQGSHIGYDEVIVTKGSEGKTVYEYINRVDEVSYPEYPNVPTIGFSGNGLLVRETNYRRNDDGTFSKVKAIARTYTIGARKKIVRAMKVPSADAVNYIDDAGTIPMYSNVKFYDMVSDWLHPDTDTVRIYSQIDDAAAVQEITTYKYNNSQWSQLSETSVIDSKNKLVKTTYKYPYDFPGSTVYTEMVANNQVGIVIEETSTSDGSHLRSIKTNYTIWPNNIVLPSTTESRIGSRSYETRIRSHAYSVDGLLLSQSKENDVRISYKWGYNSQYPLAEIYNAAQNEFYYEGFEEGGNIGILQQSAKTGRRVRATGFVVNFSAPAGRAYVLSYWYRLTSTGAWMYKEINYTGGSYTITDGAYVDEVRIYPKDASMRTFTYDPLIGITSETDAAGKTVYYEYDSFKQLKLIKDQNGKILKQYDYQYQKPITQ